MAHRTFPTVEEKSTEDVSLRYPEGAHQVRLEDRAEDDPDQDGRHVIAGLARDVPEDAERQRETHVEDDIRAAQMPRRW